MYDYKSKVTRVIDGDTIEALVDLGLIHGSKSQLDLTVSMLGKVELEMTKKKSKD